MVAKVGELIGELVRQTDDAFELRIICGTVSKDHVYILDSAPPTLAYMLLAANCRI
ncbi:MAG: hypothetical protein HQL68_04780 [Magnetococcales bacterium]|nr:hypothetical protein [Magnetococcales bacterium]